MMSDTSMILNIKENASTKEIATIIRKALQSKAIDEVEIEAVNTFCDDIEIKDGQILVEGGWSLASWEFEYLREAVVAIAKETDCEFIFEADHHSLNCGYEAYIEAEYKSGILTYKHIAAEDMVGYCEDCGEIIVNAFDYDPTQTYTCPECGRVVSEEELFPNGVPTWEVEKIRIN